MNVMVKLGLALMAAAALVTGCSQSDTAAPGGESGTAGSGMAGTHAHMEGEVVDVIEGEPQTACPVMGLKIDKDIYVDYGGKRIYFCCQACVESP